MPGVFFTLNNYNLWAGYFRPTAIKLRVKWMTFLWISHFISLVHMRLAPPQASGTISFFILVMNLSRSKFLLFIGLPTWKD